MATAAKTAFNLKVLRRHDPSIVDIIDSASFVVLYNHQAEWTKTGVEGPMFLFRRNKAPYHGFFIMNRNGVENFSADMTPDDDLEITPEFIIYRPDSSADNDVYGIWIFESSQRLIIGEQMLTLQQMASPPPTTAATLQAQGEAQDTAIEAATTASGATANGSTSEEAALQGGQISLDALFGSPQGTPTPAAAHTTHEASLLNTLFSQASLQSSEATKQGEAAGVSKKQSPAPESAKRQPEDSSQSLLALLGVRQAPAQMASAPPSAAAAQDRMPPTVTDTSEREAKPAAPEPETITTAPAPNGTSSSEVRMTELVCDGINDRIGLGDDGQPLGRREFVRELLSLVHTEPSFVDGLHKAYVEHVSR